MSAASLGTAQAYVAAILLGLSLLCLPLAYLRAWRFWRPAPGPLGDAGLGVGGAVLIAAILRFAVAPLLIATIFIGYRQTAQAIALLPIPHYGAGAASLYHALFAVFPADHTTLMWVNSVVGVLTLPLWATVVARVFDDRRAGVIAAAIIALLPMLVRNDNSDANNVPCLWWLAGGLVLWDHYLEKGGRGPLLAAFALFALAAIGRPEMPALVPLFALALGYAVGAGRRPWRDPVVWVGGLVAAALVVPHFLHVFGMIGELQQRESLPGLSMDRLRDLPYLLRRVNTLIAPTLFPPPLLVLAGLALVLEGGARGRKAAAAFWLLVPVAFIVYVVDLDRANMARVQVPAALIVVLLASAALSRIFERLRSWWIRAPLAVGLLVSAVPSAHTLYAPTNEQQEETLIQEALAKLPPGPFTLVRIGHGDADDEAARHTHFHFPDYLVSPPRRPGRVRSVAQWSRASDYSTPAFFFWGFRCYARFRMQDAPAPAGDNLQPVCARLRSEFQLVPVFEREVKNRGDVWLEYYGTSEALRVGLYRILPKPEAKSAAGSP